MAILPGLRYHDLRQSAGKKMLERGTPLATVAQVLGWIAATAARRREQYSHMWPEAQRRALESIVLPLPTPAGAGTGADSTGDRSQVPSQVPSVHQLSC